MDSSGVDAWFAQAQQLEAAGQLEQSAELYKSLSVALTVAGQRPRAIEAMARSLRLRPADAEAMIHLAALVLRPYGKVNEAIQLLGRALALRPGDARGLCGLGNAWRDAGDARRAIEYYRAALAAAPQSPEIAGNLLYTLNFDPSLSAAEILREHQQWAAPLSPMARIWPAREAREKLKIGYVSADFRQHVVGGNLLPWLSRHDHGHYEIYCYSGVRSPDGMTVRIRDCVDGWREIAHLNDEQVAAQVQADGVDILVDLALHGAGGRPLLFARKPAPVQAAYLGYPGTTGLAAMDWRLSDPHLDPPEADESGYCERTLRLPATYWCYQPGGPTPEVTPAPAIANGFITFGCLNNFAKVSPQALEVWTRILSELPNARLILHAPAQLPKPPAIPRVEYLGFVPWQHYIQSYQRIDVALDPFPYCGGITTCDALWMGVPVITLSGPTAVGRSGRSILNNVGLPELVASSIDDYISLAKQADRWIALRPALRQRIQQSPLMDAGRFARDIEAAYRTMWQTP